MAYELPAIRTTARDAKAARQCNQVTTESVRAAQKAMLAEREALKTLGIEFDPFRDGQIKRDRRCK